MSLFNTASLFYRRGMAPALTQTRRNFSIVDWQAIMSPSGEYVGAVFHGVNDQHEGETDAAYVERSRFDMLNAVPPSLRNKSLLLLNTEATVVDAEAYEKAEKESQQEALQVLRSPRYVGHSMAAIVTISEDMGMSIQDKTGISFVGTNTLETPEAMMHSFFPNRGKYKEMIKAKSFQTMVLMSMSEATRRKEEVVARAEVMRKAAQDGELRYDRLYASCVHRVHEVFTGKTMPKLLSKDKESTSDEQEPSSAQIGGLKMLQALFPQYSSERVEDEDRSQGRLYQAVKAKGLATRSYEVDNIDKGLHPWFQP